MLCLRGASGRGVVVVLARRPSRGVVELMRRGASGRITFVLDCRRATGLRGMNGLAGSSISSAGDMSTIA